ncbi:MULTISPECIES: hypothetical protein [Porphyromonadaceae]|uniref:Uncharacterized protein n=1 Tax=Sanguibacteroides justesenii TaxID=1547597 RepID=A0A0C3REA2_9PORP|nr:MULTISPECIES: hypothetical protein [Porphyromonadaceae]KIO43056.1 hypothetical protein IE90_12620 [Sanguibacteroides justesenii]KIO44771.1 hypothetical protein BA92_07020 [Sanguibacteroides justesenii]PXZ43262.1 hypothetical protein DMB45_10670 [Sanguibacteroides justesenii]
MTEKEENIIKELNLKIEQLIKRYISSLDKNKNLEAEIQALRNRIEQLKGENSRLNENIKALKVANAISTGDGSSEAKIRISQLVREIDKCIALLNN